MTETAVSADVDDESLAMLMEEVSAMAESGRPLMVGLAEMDDLSIGKLGRAANSVLESLSRGNSAADSLAALSTKYGAPIRVAMQVTASTGSTEPIHDTVRLIRETNEHRRQMRLAAIHPMVNVIVATLVACFVIPWVLVSLSDSGMTRLAFSPTLSRVVQALARDFVIAAVVSAVLIGLFAALLSWGVSLANRGVNTLRDHATFCRWLAMQLTVPVRPDSSPAVGLELSGVTESAVEVVGPSFAASWDDVIKSIRGGARSVPVSSVPAGTPEPIARCIDDLVSGSRDSESIANDLRWLSELYTQNAHRHRTWWAELAPRWVMWVLMIALMLVMMGVILRPLFEVVGEVAS